MKKFLQTLYLIGAFFAIDALLRVLTRWLGYYSIYKLAPSLFSLCWIIILVTLLLSFPRKIGRLLFGLSYYSFSIYSIVQYVYYLIFNRFLFFSDLRLASEGIDYVSYIKTLLNGSVIFQIMFLFVAGIIGLFAFPKYEKRSSGLIGLRILFVLLSATGIMFIPSLFNYNINSIVNAKYEYETFTSSGFDMEICGYYHFMARDAWVTYLKPKEDVQELVDATHDFLDSKQSHYQNEMTGFLEGKNIIIIQMETIDDWMIGENDTPCINRLMKEGICFSNFYTPCFGTGWTFGTEFAFNAGVYQGTTVYSGERLARNHFPLSIAMLAQSKGYYCNSLHENLGSYYSRSSMHSVLGYTYHCSRDYLMPNDYEIDDTTLISNDECWKILTEKKPFFSFLITMSAHLPYTSDDETVQYAFQKYSEYDATSDEVNNLRLKARLTDDMFSLLLKRLEEDDLLKDTVILAYCDHYSYGISDKEKLKELSQDAGSQILEKTPAFIWYKGYNPQEIGKTCQTIDWLPTLANMLGIEVNNQVLGRDIFDPEYVGYALFPDNTWIYSDCYVKNGQIVNQGSLSKDEIDRIERFFKRASLVNQYILQSDFYENNKSWQ